MRHLIWLPLLAALVLISAAPISQMASRWAADPAYTHGYLVPLFSLYLLWHRRSLWSCGTPAVSWGIGLIGLATGLMLAAEVFFYQTLAHYSLPLFLAGACLVLGGWPALGWAWPAAAFLFFMVPLPGPLADALGGPLQRIATQASTYLIQAVGVPAVADGNIILLSREPIGVAEACSGLRMLVLFVAIAAGFVLLIDRKPWEKLLILVSAVPIAVVANVCRITLTAMMYEWVGDQAAQFVFHDFAGWLMMPLAVVLLTAEMVLLSKLLVEERPSTPVVLGFGDGPLSGPAFPGGGGGSASALRSPVPRT